MIPLAIKTSGDASSEPSPFLFALECSRIYFGSNRFQHKQRARCGIIPLPITAESPVGDGRDGTMESIRDILLKPKKKETPILDEIRSTVSMIHAMQQWFNTESDADLIEACVFQLESLEARYRYLLRMAKDRGLYHDALTGDTAERRSA